MPKFKTKFDLSPRLKFGLGRGYTKNQILKFFSFTFLSIAAGLAFNSLWVVVKYDRNPKSAQTENAAPQVLGVTDVRLPQTELQYLEYKIKKGDTLFNLSQEYSVNWMTLATLNNLKSPFSLKPGQTIKIPK
jgi:LysM repeat protein